MHIGPEPVRPAGRGELGVGNCVGIVRHGIWKDGTELWRVEERPEQNQRDGSHQRQQRDARAAIATETAPRALVWA